MYNNYGLNRFVKFGKSFEAFDKFKQIVKQPEEVKLYLTVQNNTIVDASNNPTTLTLNGTTVSNVIKREGKSASIYTNGIGSLLTAADSKYLLGTSDFTIEFWFNTPVSTASSDILGSRVVTDYNWTFYDNSCLMSTTPEVHNVIITNNPNIPLNTWTHICMTRQSDMFRLFQNGILQGSFSASGSVTSTNRIAVGGTIDTTNRIAAYYDDIKITMGSALYTANFDINTI